MQPQPKYCAVNKTVGFNAKQFQVCVDESFLSQQ